MSIKTLRLLACHALTFLFLSPSAATVIPLPTSIWDNCRDGADTLAALAAFHRPYTGKDVTIRYPANQTIHVTITQGAQTIWLPARTDFNGCTIIAKNTNRAFFLFAIARPDDAAKPVEIEKKQIDGGNFSRIAPLASGTKMLLLTDTTPWVENRAGYSYGATRKDILLIKNGKTTDRATAPYNTPATMPQCKYLEADTIAKTFSNLTFVRHEASTSITNLLNISLQNNVSIANVAVLTPPPASPDAPVCGDQCFKVRDAVDVTVSSVTVRGTYSDYNQYGYAINMDNVRRSRFVSLRAEAEWGIFGNNNIHTATLDSCDINRFDIHCYGRDVMFNHCTFRNAQNNTNTYNQFSSVYGTIKFSDCKFLEFCPILHEYSYNAYTSYDLVMRNCYMELNNNRNSIVNVGFLSNEINSRPELSSKCWPNITIDGLTIKTNGVPEFYLFKVMGDNLYGKKVGYLSNITVNRLTFIPTEATINFTESTFNVKTAKRLKRNISLPHTVTLKKRIN